MNKKHILLIVVVMVLLAVAISALVMLNDPGELIGGQIEIIVKGESVAVFTADQITELPSVAAQKKITDSAGHSVSGKFTGVTLHELLDSAAPNWQDEATRVGTWAEDSFISAFDPKEITGSDNIFIAYMLDGKYLTAEDGGPFRIVAVRDPFGTRSTRWLCRVEVY